MNYYEVTNGYTGESYVRVYVWCADEETALRMAAESFRAHRATEVVRRRGDDYWTNLTVKLLFSSDAAPFATEPSDG